MIYLYKVNNHPLTGEFIIQKYEIVHSTPKKFYIQPRNIKNSKAEGVEKVIWKDSARYPLPTMNDYFYSAREAWQDFIAKQDNIIKDAEAKIERANDMIDALKRDIPEASLAEL